MAAPISNMQTFLNCQKWSYNYYVDYSFIHPLYSSPWVNEEPEQEELTVPTITKAKIDTIFCNNMKEEEHVCYWFLDS